MSQASEKHPAPDALFSAFPPVPDEAWEQQIRQDLGAGFAERLTWKAPSNGVDVYAYYRAENTAALGDGAPLSRSGAAGNAWRIRQDLSHPDLGEANRHAREALDGGATDLGLAIEADDGALRGLPLQRPRDVERLLDGIALEETPLHLDAGHATPALLAMLLVEAERRGLNPDVLHGSAAYDPLATLARRGALPADAYDRAAQLVAHAAERLPHLRTLAADARPYHDAGASAVDELACALAAASEHFARLAERGVAPAEVVQTLHFVVPVGTSFLVEISKLRALRLLYRQVAETYLPEEEDAPPAHVHAVTSRREATVYDPHANLLRATTEAAAATLGGCDVLSVRPYDAALRAPSDFSQRLARGTQLVLQHEAGFARVADPAAGAYYVEAVTEKLARAAWTRFQEIEAEGGLLETLQSGSVQKKIAQTRAKRVAAVAERRRVLVGTNQYPRTDEKALPKIEDTRLARVPFETAGYTLPPNASPAELRQAFTDGATLGDVLAAEDAAEQITAEPLPTFRAAEAFEKLRLRTERRAQEGSARAVVFLLPFGPRGMRSARANFARNLFGCAGFLVEEGAAGYDPPAEGVEAARASGAEIVALCSADDAYAEHSPALCQQLKALDPAPLVVIAGRQDGHVENALRQAGADGFIYKGQNALDTLERYQRRLGIPT